MTEARRTIALSLLSMQLALFGASGPDSNLPETRYPFIQLFFVVRDLAFYRHKLAAVVVVSEGHSRFVGEFAGFL